ncbi:MAG TPA: hypothetical protein VEN29_00570 [Casimicrobiaceae bacterium]|nr:hypothetical protein [Casimicrobiaceae bacterium]
MALPFRPTHDKKGVKVLHYAATFFIVAIASALPGGKTAREALRARSMALSAFFPVACHSWIPPYAA